MEEEAAALIADYQSKGVKLKPIVGFIAGQSTERSRLYGHAGAIWYEESEKAQKKIALWRSVGIRVADRLGDIGGLIKEAVDEIDSVKNS